MSDIKIAEYDLNGDRDFLSFNITEYEDEKLNRIGSKEDGRLLEKTLSKKGFKLRAFCDGQISKESILSKMNDYVKELRWVFKLIHARWRSLPIQYRV